MCTGYCDCLPHAGGSTFEEALEQVAMCMFSYMTDLDTVEFDPACCREVKASGVCVCGGGVCAVPRGHALFHRYR